MRKERKLKEIRTLEKKKKEEKEEKEKRRKRKDCRGTRRGIGERHERDGEGRKEKTFLAVFFLLFLL